MLPGKANIFIEIKVFIIFKNERGAGLHLYPE